MMRSKEKITLTNMCMIHDEEGNVLVQNRKDRHWAGIVFPGGHVEQNESFVESVIREIKEETGLTIEQPKLCGIKQFWDSEGDRYIVFLFKTSHFSGKVVSSDEGEVFWMKLNEINEDNCAKGFLDMIQIFNDDSIEELIYCENKKFI